MYVFNTKLVTLALVGWVVTFGTAIQWAVAADIYLPTKSYNAERLNSYCSGVNIC